MSEFIKIRGARVNNLKSVDVDIPMNKLTCFTGPSGSGKTSLAFETVYSESKRRFINSFPTSMKFFVDRPAPVDVDSITPVLPVFGLPQINPVIGTRSNVADVMHLTGLFQNFFGNYAHELCPVHQEPFRELSFSDYISNILTPSEREGVYHLFVEKEEYIEKLINTPFPSRTLKSRRSRKITDFDKDHQLWEVMRFKFDKIEKINKKYHDLKKHNLRLLLFSPQFKKMIQLNFVAGEEFFCPIADCSEHPSGLGGNIMSFSPYNALGACSDCNGFGETLDYDINKLYDLEKSVQDGGVLLLNYKRFSGQLDELIYQMKKLRIPTSKPIETLPQKFFDLLYEGAGEYYGFNAYFAYLERKRYKMNVRIFVRNLQKGSQCRTCGGSRLGLHVGKFFAFQKSDQTLSRLLTNTIFEVYRFFESHLDDLRVKSSDARKAYKKIIRILKIANDVGLGHLKLLRKSKTLSAGEYQRLLLLKYLSYDGTGALFIFDEPSLGLNESEMRSLHAGFRDLIKNGNTVILIDHNAFLLRLSDYIVEVGPQAGHLGGMIVYQGERSGYHKEEKNEELVPLKIKSQGKILLKKPQIYGRQFADVQVRIGGLNWVVGESGSGKSSCMINILADCLNYQRFGEHLNLNRGDYKTFQTDKEFDDVIIIDSNLNRYTSRSTVGSMTGFFPVFRKHFVNTPMAKAMGLQEGHLSYNSELGQCSGCEGKGHTVVEMQFLEDIVLTCEDCKGRKLKSQYASITDGKYTVHEAFSSPISQVIPDIKLTPKFKRIYEYMKLLNLDYLSLDRKITSLSGGEKQRIYLLNKLQKDVTDSVIFFENISFGLSRRELVNLSRFLQDLCLKGNTVVVIDQNKIFGTVANQVIAF